MGKAKRYVFGIFMLLLVGSLFGNSSIAKASNSNAFGIWQINDGFEGATIWDRWSCWNTVAHPDNGCGLFTGGGARVHGGSNSAILKGYSGWSDIGRYVSVTAWTPGKNLMCLAKIYLSVNDIAFPDGFKGQLEVIDVDTWSYLVKTPFTLTTHNWTAITTPTWILPRKNIFVRVDTIGNGWAEQFAYVDDMNVTCI